MQVSKISKSQKNLRQGTIFSFKALKFEDDESSTITFAQMYPKVDLQKIAYGVVLSQTCDLVDDEKRKIKTPYIQVGLLEPTEVYFEEKFKEELKNAIAKYTAELNLASDGTFKFIDEEKINDWIGKQLINIFQNNNPFYYFISIKQGKAILLFNVNISKTFALRSWHHKTIRGNAKYQLKPFFESKLGWKLAEMYGRVGTPDYKEAEIKKLSTILMKKVEKTFSEFGDGHLISSELYERIKKANGNGKLQDKKDLFSEIFL